jgi:error-prone DNA polymerase
MDSFLRKRVEEGVIRRYGTKRDHGLLERAKKQAEHELALIARLGFAGYFLIVWDIVLQFCENHDILIQGRGSTANSAVCYALEITAIDPVGMELPFECFLSESRGEWPDIDLDLPSKHKRYQCQKKNIVITRRSSREFISESFYDVLYSEDETSPLRRQ